MDQLTSNHATPSLKAHEHELAERILQFGFFLDLCLGDLADNQPGHRALGIEGTATLIWAVSPDDLDVQQYRVGRILPFLFDYAYNARRVEGSIDWSEWNSEADERYLFGAFVEMTDIENVAAASAEYDYTRTGLLRRMLKLADARHRLDFGDELTIDDIALLADMNERSVRNALRADGENRLASRDGEHVTAEEAMRWLRGRRGGFRETTVVEFDGETLPAVLSYSEMPLFINHRLARLYPVGDTDADGDASPVAKAAKILGWPVQRVFAIAQDTANIRPQDCSALAKILRVDAAWFTEQVMCALFPKQMALISHRREPEEVTSKFQSAHIDVELTENGIKHGYLDIPSSLSAFFPTDCFGGRGEHDRGAEVTLRYGGQSRTTDIRIKSSVTISPRVRFGSYFSTLRAKPGDVIRISRIDDRTFELTYVAK